MPHVIVKMYPGRSETQKQALADAITREVINVTACDEQWVSVAVQEVDPSDWPEQVYKPDILAKSDHLYKRPGYNPFE